MPSIKGTDSSELVKISSGDMNALKVQISKLQRKMFRDTMEMIVAPTCPVCGEKPTEHQANDYDWYQFTKGSKWHPSGEKFGTKHWHFWCKDGHYWCGSGRPINAKIDLDGNLTRVQYWYREVK